MTVHPDTNALSAPSRPKVGGEYWTFDAPAFDELGSLYVTVLGSAHNLRVDPPHSLDGTGRLYSTAEGAQGYFDTIAKVEEGQPGFVYAHSHNRIRKVRWLGGAVFAAADLDATKFEAVR
ncbi:hypothetical protein B7435_16900 [Mycolicibacterium peregrinum]|uniref:hypothetical protein n=1 Tax=Mycolicibacterium peregrinum TaxID=43304 RepID=UPI000B4B57AC|nr:hypothetical protein [Mycolicibacterium peregrinum]OWM01240.1 hypothetical protein B7435_16900 [Mycolicibacterium peregrinum]